MSDCGTIKLHPFVNTEREFAPGEIVELKSGGPDMTVLGQCPECGNVEVGWFDIAEGGGFGYFNAETFPAAALNRVNE